jgi:hypothetical protein
MSASRSFDPQSPGARQLARTWLPHLERWQIRHVDGSLLTDHGVIQAGEIFEVPGPHGRRLVEGGSAELISRRRIRAHD